MEHGRNRPEVDRTCIDERGSCTEAPVFGTASASRSSSRQTCSWPPVSGNPHPRAWFILSGVVRTASAAGSRLELKRRGELPSMAATVDRVVGRPLAP
ncbi:hypothetical protein HPB52_023684 [Rhipicephalus sanguineus]|uniref:Uncharacterized protein n=1 Tax=Rhipicephalus sanguineus TaxID=34632 RepID=A0A9D4TC84_RHISA|nr:hypothetical protein HPB52_023684 [Rhipicephalus sanguineus]